MEEYVPIEIAKKLKEKGFDWETSNVYEKNILACRYEDYPKPTISQVLKWLREEKKIHTGVLYHGYYAVWIQPMKRNEAEHVIHDCKTHEGAELEGIDFVLDNLI
jgi:hypothetical protein